MRLRGFRTLRSGKAGSRHEPGDTILRVSSHPEQCLCEVEEGAAALPPPERVSGEAGELANEAAS